ncbi:MAG: ATP-grasp domain-containing protein [Treponema sp.]
MNEKTVLILGAGLMQKPALLAAKELGFCVAAVDGNPAAAYAHLADFFKPVDLKDKDGILAFAQELQKSHNLCAVFTAGTDFSASVSYAAERLGLPCHSYEAALNASIKDRMRRCFDAHGVPSPRYRSFAADDDIPDDLTFPLVVKPVDNMGARGCRLARNRKELESAVSAARKSSRSAVIIIEDFIEGDEFSIDALVYNGAMTVTGFAVRHIYFPPYFIETGHTMPCAIDETKRRELIAAFALGVKALGLTHGAAKADIKYSAHGPVIGEIAARLSGGYMSGWTFPYASDLNLTAQGILIAAGMQPAELESRRVPVDFTPPSSCAHAEKPFDLYEVPCTDFSAERAWISIPGTIARIEGLEEAAAVPFVENVFPRPVKAGDAVDFPRNNVEKCGNVITRAPAREQAVLAAETAVSKILVRLEPDNPRTEDFLAGRELPDEKGFPPCAFDAFFELDAIDLCGEISAGESIVSSAPEELGALLTRPQKDWTHSTALEAARAFDEREPEHPAMNKERFWSALFKGGVQAALYVSDTASKARTADVSGSESGV